MDLIIGKLKFKNISIDDLNRILDLDLPLQEALARAPQRRKAEYAADRAKKWLTEKFLNQTTWTSNELLESAKVAGLSRNSVFAARKTLGILVKKQGSTWVWYIHISPSHIGSILN